MKQQEQLFLELCHQQPIILNFKKMSKYFKNSVLLIYLILTACTDVVDVEVPVAPERLVIEASLAWELGTLGNVQTIKLSTSTPYFESDKEKMVTGAFVQVTNNATGNVFVFDDQKLKSASFDVSKGFGLRAIAGEATGYAHSSDIDTKSLKKASDTVSFITKNNNGSF